MAKQKSKEEKIEIPNFKQKHTTNEIVQKYDVSESTLKRWKKRNSTKPR